MENENKEAAVQSEEAVPNIVFVRAKKKKERKSLQPTIQVLVSLVTAIVAVSGILLSYQTFRLNAEEKAAQREAAVAAQERQELADRNNRFSYAIEHLKDESLAIRMGALYELKKLGVDDEGLQENIVRILGPFIREGIENKELLTRNRYALLIADDDGLPPLENPNTDIYLACEITSLFWEQTGHSVSLTYLKAEGINFGSIQLKGATLAGAQLKGSNLYFAQLQETSLLHANLQGAFLNCANLKGASLMAVNAQEAMFNGASLEETEFGFADLRDADFSGAHLQGTDLSFANNLTVEQLIVANIDEHTHLYLGLFNDGENINSIDLSKDPRIQARIAEVKAKEQEQKPE